MSPPLAVVGGYLGSGKSTLVNRLLTRAALGRTAVVVNDFGSVNIDARMIASSSAETIELTNGCLCCQITDDVSRTMRAVAARGDLDHVICEVSGVGDPSGLSSWQHFPGFRPGPVLVCADATAVARQLRDEYVADVVARQLAHADVVLMTKTDVVPPSALGLATDAVHRAASGVRLVLQDPEDPDRTAVDAFAAPPARRAGTSTADGPAPGVGDAGGHRSVTLREVRGVDVAALARAVSGLGARIVRAKGDVQDRDGTWHRIQLANGRVASTPTATRKADDAALVLIAAGPDPAGHLAAAVDRLRSAGALGDGA